MKKDKCLVVLSGGQDSTTCLYWAKDYFEQVYAVTYDYGQRHKIEIDSAIWIAKMAGVVEHEVIKVGAILQSSSPLVSKNKLEQYDDFNSLPGGLEKTFVPGRNMLFLTLAANHAHARGITHVITGVCEEDFGGYPDCRQRFIDSVQETIIEGFCDCTVEDLDPFKQFTIETPLMRTTKADTVRLARCLPGCWEALAYSHTAYDGAYPPIGHDHATLLRAKGFAEAGFPDPLVLRAVAEGLMPLPNAANYADTAREHMVAFNAKS